MKVMLIGGTGVLSKDIAKECIESKVDLYMINRGKKLQYVPQNAHIIIGDINDSLSLLKNLQGLEFDVVVDFLSYTPKQLSRTLELFHDKCKQYIFISSATVYSKENPDELITEETSLTNYGWDYSKNKIECEKLLEQECKTFNLQFTIVRPYITYGTTRIPFALISKKQQWTLVDRILKNKPIVIWDDGKSICTVTHTEDFAKGVVGLFGNPKALGQAFHITSDEHLSWQDLLENLAKAVDKEVRIVYIPSKLIEGKIQDMRGELTEDKSITRKFDNTKIKTVLKNFHCSTMFSEGIRRTINYYQRHPELMLVDHEWDAKIDILIYNYYKENYPDKLNNKENFGLNQSKMINRIHYIKCLIIVAFYKMINIIKWFIIGSSIRIKRVMTRIKI